MSADNSNFGKVLCGNFVVNVNGIAFPNLLLSQATLHLRSCELLWGDIKWT